MAWSFSIIALMGDSLGSVRMWVISCSVSCLVLIFAVFTFSLQSGFLCLK